MKKNIYFVISAVIKIIFCLGMIIASKEIVNQLINVEAKLSTSYENIVSSTLLNNNSSLESIKEDTESNEVVDNENDSMANELSSKLLEEMPMDMQSFYTKFIIASAIMIIIFNCLIIYYYKSNSIFKHKNSIIVYSIISFLFGMNLVVMLLSIVDFITVLCLKPKDPEDFPKPVKKIEPIEQEAYTKKQKIEAIVLVIVYFICILILPSIMAIFYDDESKYDLFFYLVMIIVYLFTFAFAIKTYYKELKSGFKAFKENFRDYKYFVIKRFIITLVVVAVANVLRFLITQNIQSVNQESVSELSSVALFFLAVIWAPIVEEAIFRGTLKRFISNRWVYVLLTGIIFGALHAVNEESLFLIAVTTLPYAIMGFSFADTYYKSNNILTNIFMHVTNNFLGTVLLFLIR